jgi:hypothetical protein
LEQDVLFQKLWKRLIDKWNIFCVKNGWLSAPDDNNRRSLPGIRDGNQIDLHTIERAEEIGRAHV